MNPLTHYGHDTPLPHIHIHTPPPPPGWTLHLAHATTTATLLTTAATGTGLLTTTAGLLTLTALTALSIWHPSPTTAATTLLATATLLLIWGHTPFDTRTLWLAPLTWIHWRTTWWATHTPLTSHIETTALLTGWRRTTTILALTEALALAAWAITTTSGFRAAIAVGAAGLVALAVLALPRRP